MPSLDPSRALRLLVPEPGPKRAYVLAHLVNSFGLGLIMPTMVLYLTQAAHLSSTQAGFGFTIAVLVGLLAAVPIGDLADRRGPSGTARLMMLMQGVFTMCYLFVDNFLIFVIIAAADMLASSAYGAAAGPLLRRVGGEDAVAFRSTARAIGHVGISLGAVGAGIGLAIGTPDAYRTLIFVNGLTFLAAWLLLFRLPHYDPLPKEEDDGEPGPRWVALRDRPFVAYTVIAGAMFIQYLVLELPLPLWIVRSTDAPRWSVSLVLVLNTVLVILFQVQVGSRVETIRQGGTALLRSGVIFLISCSAIGFLAGLPGWAAFLLLVGVVSLHTFGEMIFASASYALDFGLAPASAQGQYQGLAGIGTGLGGAAAPVLLIGLVLSLGRSGWIGLGVCFFVLGLAGPALARWGERTRPAKPVETESAQQEA